MSPATTPTPRRRAGKKPASPPPVGLALQAAAGTLSAALAPLMAQVLAATDVFDAARHKADLSDHDRRLAAELLKATREAWSVLSWWGEEAGRLAKGEATR